MGRKLTALLVFKVRTRPSFFRSENMPPAKQNGSDARSDGNCKWRIVSISSPAFSNDCSAAVISRRLSSSLVNKVTVNTMPAKPPISCSNASAMCLRSAISSATFGMNIAMGELPHFFAALSFFWLRILARPLSCTWTLQLTRNGHLSDLLPASEANTSGKPYNRNSLGSFDKV